MSTNSKKQILEQMSFLKTLDMIYTKRCYRNSAQITSTGGICTVETPINTPSCMSMNKIVATEFEKLVVMLDDKQK